MKLSAAPSGPFSNAEVRPVQGDLRQAGQRAQDQVLDAGLGRRGQRHRLAVAAQAAVHPEDVQHFLTVAGERDVHKPSPSDQR